RDELEARGWTQVELAEILGRPQRLVSELISAKRAISPETARGLAAAFGTSADLWMNLESQWQLSKTKTPDDEVARRSRLYQNFPVKEMIKRQWIKATNDIDELESQFKQFFGIQHLDDELELVGAFRRKCDESLLVKQQAWLTRARQLAGVLQVPPFKESGLAKCVAQLRKLLVDPAEARHVPRVLSESGIRFLIVEAFPGSGVDGVCFWLDERSPVIVLSLRFDRIDWFWFTLFHELTHLKYRDGIEHPRVDIQIVGDDQSATDEPEEQRANQEAQENLIPSQEMDNFIARVRPLYSYERVIGFSNRMQVHPGIVVGQLQKRKEIPYANLRKLLSKIKAYVLPSSVVDGWGQVPSIKA